MVLTPRFLRKNKTLPPPPLLKYKITTNIHRDSSDKALLFKPLLAQKSNERGLQRVLQGAEERSAGGRRQFAGVAPLCSRSALEPNIHYSRS